MSLHPTLTRLFFERCLDLEQCPKGLWRKITALTFAFCEADSCRDPLILANRVQRWFGTSHWLLQSPPEIWMQQLVSKSLTLHCSFQSCRATSVMLPWLGCKIMNSHSSFQDTSIFTLDACKTSKGRVGHLPKRTLRSWPSASWKDCPHSWQQAYQQCQYLRSNAHVTCTQEVRVEGLECLITALRVRS